MEEKNIQVTANHFIELDFTFSGNPIARLMRKINSGTNKGTYKKLEGYRFNDITNRDQWISQTVSKLKASEENEKIRQEIKQQINLNFDHPFKQGQIYYDEWGYEQTNINFYTVMEVKTKSVILQEIGKKIIRYTGHMSAFIEPDPQNLVGKPFLKKILFTLDYKNQPKYHISSERGWISLYNPDQKKHCSWYA